MRKAKSRLMPRSLPPSGLTGLEEQIVGYRIDHPEATVEKIADDLGCSHMAVREAMSDPRCNEREIAIRGAVDKARVASLQERQEKLTEIIRAKLGDYMNEKGEYELKKESPNQAAIAEYSVVMTRRGLQRELKLHSVIDAIEALDREEGIGRPQVLTDQRSINITHVTVVEHPSRQGSGEESKGEGKRVEIEKQGGAPTPDYEEGVE